MLIKTDVLPENILNLEAHQLHKVIDNHTMVHLKGKISRPLFISILQHGDETTGWDAIKIYLKQHSTKLPRDMIILFGNIQAAAKGLRQLPNQRDFNRSWPTGKPQTDVQASVMSEITDLMQKTNLFASVDIHNNSGRNPHYAGINSLDIEFQNLASLFSDTIIYFTKPDGVQSKAFAKFCPAITIECGLSGTADGIEQTHTFLENLMYQNSLQNIPGIAEHQKIYRIFSNVRVDSNITIGLDKNTEAELIFEKDLDFMNFQTIPAGNVIGKTNGLKALPLSVIDTDERDITDEYFVLKNNQIITQKTIVPAMITQNIKAMKMDCLCYLMQPILINNNGANTNATQTS